MMITILYYGFQMGADYDDHYDEVEVIACCCDDQGGLNWEAISECVRTHATKKGLPKEIMLDFNETDHWSTREIGGFGSYHIFTHKEP